MIGALVSFAAIAALLTVTPGVDTALVIRAAVSSGRRQAIAVALGVFCGCLVWAVAAAAGVTALLVAAPPAYAALRLAGACYLVFLGVRLALGSRRSATTDAAASPGEGEQAESGLAAHWRKGFFVNLLNPKVGVFYVALIPQFLVPGVPPIVMGLLLALVHNLEGMIWFAIIIGSTVLAKRWLTGGGVLRVVDRVTAVVLVVFGIVVAAEVFGWLG